MFQALLNAAISRNDPYMQLLLSQTAGIIFLGTPHQGSDVATFAYQVAKITVSGNKPLLRALKANCPALFDDVQSFHQISEGMKIYSFYETMETYGLGIVCIPYNQLLVSYITKHVGIY